MMIVHMTGREDVKILTWDEVFRIWESLEAHLPHWETLYKGRGWSSWQEWRTKTLAAGFRLPELSWTLGRIPDPMAIIPTFRGGPFRSWIDKAYGGRHSPTPTFAELAGTEFVRAHDVIRQISEAFPERTTLIGLKTADGIVVVEGTHRSCAIALAAAEGRSVKSEVHIALAEYPFGPLPILGQELKS
jgi:hypothetical protein